MTGTWRVGGAQVNANWVREVRSRGVGEGVVPTNVAYFGQQRDPDFPYETKEFAESVIIDIFPKNSAEERMKLCRLEYHNAQRLAHDAQMSKALIHARSGGYFDGSSITLFADSLFNYTPPIKCSGNNDKIVFVPEVFFTETRDNCGDYDIITRDVTINYFISQESEPVKKVMQLEPFFDALFIFPSSNQ